MTRTTVVIPARGGSKGIPNKNLVHLGGMTLVQRAVRLARSVTASVVVTTDSEEIMESAMLKMPDLIPVYRDKDLARDDTPLDPVIVNAASQVSSDIIITLLPTCPFVDLVSIVDATITGPVAQAGDSRSQDT